MLAHVAEKNNFDTRYTVSPKLVNDVFSTINLKSKKTHSKSFFKSLSNRKTKIENVKTA